MQVNEFVKRVRAAKIHIMIMGHLRAKMPAMMGKQKAQEKMLKNLSEHFSLVQREHHLPIGVSCPPGCRLKHLLIRRDLQLVTTPMVSMSSIIKFPSHSVQVLLDTHFLRVYGIAS